MLGNHLGFSIYLGNFIHRTSTIIAIGHIIVIKSEQYGSVGRALNASQVKIRLTGQSWRCSLWRTRVW